MNYEIITKNGTIVYEEKIFSYGKEPLVLEVATTNLLDVKRVLDFHNVKFGLIFGTLLGSIRENNFIEHDEDTDLFILNEDKENMLSSLHDLVECGFEIGRYNGKLLSIIRNGEYIDFYFFRKSNFFYRKCDVGLVAKAKYLENTKDYKFLGEIFQVPEEAESLLVDLYGKTWKTPIKNDPTTNYNKYLIFRESIKKNIPFLFTILSAFKKLVR
jgi:lipopolysaccharide cholinephosphotransferase